MRGLAAAALAAALLLPGLPAAAQDAASLYQEGTAARKRGDHAAAKRAFAKELEAEPNDAGALEGVSLACLALGQYREARQYLERWNALTPNKPYILGLLEKAKQGEERPAAAPAAPAAKEPSLYELGTEARKRGDHRAAKEAFAKMLAADPDSGGALEGISLACMSLGQYDEAVAHLEHWDKVKPGSDYVRGLLDRARRGAAPTVTVSSAPVSGTAPAASPQPPQTAALPEPSLYEIGTSARRRGEHQAAKDAFLKMYAKDPENGAALEGLGLACLSLGQYEEARQYLEKWNAKSPRNPYILGMLARAQRGMGDDRAAFGTTLELIDADPGNLDLRHRVDSTMLQEQPGLFFQGRIRKSIGTEELNTANPQRIVYEGRTGGLRARVKATSALNITAGDEYAEDAQRNDTHGFTYFDVIERIYWIGLEYKPRGDMFFSGEYGQDYAKGDGLDGRILFSRVRTSARVRALDIDWSVYAERAPYFFRGAGGSAFFRLLRDDSAKLQAVKDLLGWTWAGRFGVDDFSDGSAGSGGTTLKSYSLQAAKETGPYYLQSGYSHDQQVFFGATSAGRLNYVMTDRYGARVRRLIDHKYQLAAGAGYTFYADASRLTDFNFDATGWLPWCKELSGVYRFSYLGYLATPSGYNTNNQTDHWLGAYWDHGWGLGLWTRFGYEHGFRWDQVRQSYDGSEWLGDLEWYRRGSLSLKVQGRYGVSTVKDNHHSLGLQARYSFK